MNLSNDALEKTTDMININNIIKKYTNTKVTLCNLKKAFVMIIN
jgi:hypothetical protein